MFLFFEYKVDATFSTRFQIEPKSAWICVYISIIKNISSYILNP